MLNLEEEDARKTEGTKTPCVPRIKSFQAKTININPALRRIFLRQACNQLMVGRITSCSCHVVVVVYKSNLKLVSVLENGLCQHQVLFVWRCPWDVISLDSSLWWWAPLFEHVVSSTGSGDLSSRACTLRLESRSCLLQAEIFPARVPRAVGDEKACQHCINSRLRSINLQKTQPALFRATKISVWRILLAAWMGINIVINILITCHLIRYRYQCL